MPRIFSGRVIFYLIFLLTLDLAITPLFQMGPIRPILLYLMIFYATFQWGWKKTIPMAIAVGVFRDLASSQFLGLETCSLVLIAILLDLLAQKIERDIFLIRMATVFLFVFSACLVNLILSSFVTESIRLSWYEIGIALGTAFYTALIMPFFFYVTRYWFHEHVALKQYELFRS